MLQTFLKFFQFCFISVCYLVFVKQISESFHHLCSLCIFLSLVSPMSTASSNAIHSRPNLLFDMTSLHVVTAPVTKHPSEQWEDRNFVLTAGNVHRRNKRPVKAVREGCQVIVRTAVSPILQAPTGGGRKGGGCTNGKCKYNYGETYFWCPFRC
jgi:hypothetical protein